MENRRSAEEQIRQDAYRIMAERGYLRRVEQAGGELERWRRYLEQLNRPGPAPQDPMLGPRIFPMMEGLSVAAWHDARQIAAAAILERSFETIRQELQAVDLSEFIDYDASILRGGQWTFMPMFVFGEEVGAFLYRRNPLPNTTRIVKSLPDVCTALPLADVTFSAHAPGTRLTPHCSWDPFRLRLHLGIGVPEKCGIRVGRTAESWKQGEVLVFSEAFEHETWNDSEQTRIVLILDLWHPELTEAERRAMLACFRKKEIRGALMRTRASANLQPIYYRRFAEAEKRDPLVAQFWFS